MTRETGERAAIRALEPTPLDRLKRDISRRLSDVCSELSEADKGAVVDRIARDQGRYPEARDPRVT